MNYDPELLRHRHAVTSHQPLDPTLGVNDALLASPERVTAAADLNSDLFLGRPNDHALDAARADDSRFREVGGVNVSFHR